MQMKDPQFFEVIQKIKESFELEKRKKLCNQILTFYKQKLSKERDSNQNVIHYKAFIELCILWEYQKNFLKIIKSFLNKEIDVDNFVSEFLILRVQWLNKTNTLLQI